MTEYTENVEMNEQLQAEEPTDASGVKNENEEKTYTQADVDNIVRNRLARERNKKKAPEIPQEQDDEKPIDQRISEDMEWFEKNVGGDFEGFLKSDEFRDFIEGTALNVRQGMEKFVKFKGADYVKGNFNRGTSHASTGSAKDSGASDLKEYYTPDDVDRLTERDLANPEIMKRVRTSMTKWK